MGWGSAFSSAFSAASNAVQSAASAAAETAQTAWDYTKQKSEEAYNAARDWIAPRADAAQEWGKETAKQAKEKGEELAQQGREAATQAKEWGAQQASEASQRASDAYQAVEDFFPSRPAGCPTQTCPYKTDHEAMPPPPRGSNGTSDPPPPCFIDRVVVQCEHTERGFKLEPPSTPTNMAMEQIIQVIVDKNFGEEMSIEFSCGNCPHGFGPTLPYLELGHETTKSSKKIVLGAPQVPSVGEGNIPFYDFAKHFWEGGGYGDYRRYHGRVHCCQGGADQDFEVQVFPQREWAVTFFAKFEKSQVAEGRKGLNIGGKLSATYGTSKIEAQTPSFESLSWFVAKMEPLCKAAQSSDIFGLEVKLPDIEVTGSAKSVERKGRYDIAWEGTLEAKFNMILGLEGTIDLIQAILLLVFKVPAPFRKMIKKVRDEAEDFGNETFGGKAVAKLDFVATGEWTGDLKWYFYSERDDVATGEMKVGLDLKVEGKIAGEIRFWVVSYEAGVTVSAKSGLHWKADACFAGKKPGWDGYVEWAGLTLEYVAYQSAGGSSTGTGNPGAAPFADNARAAANGEKYRSDKSWRAKEEYTRKIVLLEPYQWGKDEDGGTSLAGSLTTAGSSAGGGSSGSGSGSGGGNPWGAHGERRGGGRSW